MTRYSSLNYTACPACNGQANQPCGICDGHGVVPRVPCRCCLGYGAYLVEPRGGQPYRSLQVWQCASCEASGNETV